MLENTIVILCRNINEAKSSILKIPRIPNMQRFFIFLDESPNKIDLEKTIDKHDLSISLDRMLDWSDSPEKVGIRTGLFYSQGWNILFTLGEDCASIDDIQHIIEKLNAEDGPGYIKEKKIWGITREHAALFGVDELNSSSSIVNKIEPEEIDPFIVAKLLTTKENTASAINIAAALNEVIPNNNISIKHVKRTNPIYEILLQNINSYDEDFPNLIMIDDTISPAIFHSKINELSQKNILLLFTIKPEEYQKIHLAYRHFICDDLHVLLFQGTK